LRRVSEWLEAYERLPEDAKARVKRWLHLQKLIAQTLRLTWEQWLEHYIARAMAHPFDYSFMQVTFPQFVGLDAAPGQGATFTKQLDPATALIARVPLRAKNNLGRLSPELQDAIAAMLEKGDPLSAKLSPADVAHLQKIFLKEKAIAKLKKKDFKSLAIERDGDEIIITLDGGGELLRMNVLEFGVTMSKALL
jgi:hypothetical protein